MARRIGNRRIDTPALRALIAAAALAVIALVGWLAYERYREQYQVTPADPTQPDGPAVTQIVTARLAGLASLKVAELSGTVQSRATDVRGFGMLKSEQLVKMPYSVDYFVDVSRIGPGDVQWSAETRTLVVDAPDVMVARPNVRVGDQTLAQTTGLIVTREASEQLARRVAANAQGAARREAMSPERVAQAREHGREAVGALMATPLAALGYGDARVLVTFPGDPGRRSGERWDVSKSPAQAIKDARAARRP
ncbi:DUF4230 domain-containing protein [Sphingomonas baiyangensis]|uniref:DUF4230 domain-containing protein n=1 Tax=Sphingomonas baiyangensis TaxID=2572576 RepID=A0A4U1L288_9SPHN|nr:DUF4230 domain-containing protein [Sphingomonas baiyangensis]TKD50722.1 DUF4230 domain-containing protein [Sphingomonas baiyangensis]